MAPEPEVKPDHLARELPNLDALRTFAVLLVFFFHLASVTHGLIGKPMVILGVDWEPVGRAGVLLFFVHTSFVLMQSIARSKSSIGAFYARRAFRIYPLSIICVLGVLAFRIPVMPLLEFSWPGWRMVAANLLLAQNISGYASVTPPLWSLPYEVQMYLALPFIFKAITHARRGIHIAVALCVFALIAALGANTIPHGNLLYYGPCFMGGVLGFSVFRGGRISRGYIPPLAGASLLIFFTAAFIIAMDVLSVPTWGLSKTQPILSCIMCSSVGLLIPFWKQSESRLANVLFKTVAKYSYGIYLTHLSVMWFCFVKLAAPTSVRCIVFLVLSTTLPALCYHLVEDPMMRLGKRITHRSLSASAVLPAPPQLLQSAVASSDFLAPSPVTEPGAQLPVHEG
jgi:peptidoglycan/LPS O-acetylase OafA/YrhL